MDAPPDETTAAEADFQRELAARRKDLQREFDEKMRDLKAQEKRRADRLKVEQAEWEEFRRAKGKELADREHRLKGREDRVQGVRRQATEGGQELAGLRDELAAVKERRDLLARRQADLEAKAGKAQASHKANAVRLAAVLALSILGTLTWLVLALKQGGGVRVAAPLALLVLVAAAALWPAPSAKR